jgi:DNA-binding Lrp family transcriptional regulator
MGKLKEVDLRILSELTKNSKISDRKLSTILGVSQPTVTRRRARLEKEGLLDYTSVPNFRKLGLEIVAITFLSVKSGARRPRDMETVEFDGGPEMTEEFLLKHPNVILAATGRGLDKNAVWISIHEDYSSFVDFQRKLEITFGKDLNNVESFAISTESDRIRRLFDFRSFASYLDNIPSSKDLRRP